MWYGVNFVSPIWGFVRGFVGRERVLGKRETKKGGESGCPPPGESEGDRSTFGLKRADGLQEDPRIVRPIALLDAKLHHHTAHIDRR